MRRLLARVLAGTIAATALTTVAATSAANAATCSAGLIRFDGSLDVYVDTHLNRDPDTSVLGGIYAVPSTSSSPTDYVASAPLGGEFGNFSMCIPAGAYRFYVDVTSPSYGHGTGWMYSKDEFTDEGSLSIRKLVPIASSANAYAVDVAHDGEYFALDIPTLASMKDTYVSLQAQKRANEAAASAAAAAATAALSIAAPTAATTTTATYFGQLHASGAIKKSGVAKVGRTLRITPPQARELFAGKRIQWYVGGKSVSGATKTSFRLKKSYRGKTVTVVVTYYDKWKTVAPFAPLTKKTSFGKVK